MRLRAFTAALSLGVAAVCVAQPRTDGAYRAVDPADWVADVDELIEAIERTHPDMHRLHDAAQWRLASDELKRQLPGSTPQEAVWGFRRLLAMLGDSHTFFRSPPDVLPASYLPILCRVFSDGLYVRTGHRRYERQLFGRRIVAVGGLPIPELYDRVRPYINADNEWAAIDQFKSFMRSVSLLRQTGVITDDARGVVLTVEGDNGSDDVFVEATADVWVTDEWTDVERKDRPQQFNRGLNRNFGFRFLEESGTLHLVCEKVRDEDDETFAEFVERFLAVLDEKQAAGELSRVLVDVRDNNGGNGYLWQPLVRGLIQRPEVDRNGRLFVAVSRDTFSAAWLLVAELERTTNAILVGEPIPHRPNSFGDPEWIELRRSGIRVRLSALHWQNSDPRDGRMTIAPELLVLESFSSFFDRRDAILEAVIAYESETDLPWHQPNQRWMWKSDEAFRSRVPDAASLLRGEIGKATLVRRLLP
ncbi:MAG: hypothetical protein IH830_11830 [Planctomycetes bacterium]|nr:hypothetical protein [Planctomycetota bacterium]